MVALWVRDTDLNRLHPEFRNRAGSLLRRLEEDGLPFRVFEGFRSPQRQRYLFEQGRTRPGPIVTKAGPWSSFHQYGMAADFVLFEEGKWSWDDSGERRGWWDRLGEIGREEGLRGVSFERPHLQLEGTTLQDLAAGRYPPGGDEAWAENLIAAIGSWDGYPAAPPAPSADPERPPLGEGFGLEASLEGIVSPGSAGWHKVFEGQEWKYDPRGIYLRSEANGREPLRTPGTPVTCRAVLEILGPALAPVSRETGIPGAILAMTVATETGFARRDGFTGPMTFRWEPGVLVQDVDPPVWGDYSAGPMQTLASTARWVIRKQGLPFDPHEIAPVYGRRPEPPGVHPLYDPAISLAVGAAVIRQRWSRTGDDPVLVAAAYNSGGIYRSSSNPWGLRVSGNHLDRAARWYGDACAVLNGDD